MNSPTSGSDNIKGMVAEVRPPSLFDRLTVYYRQPDYTYRDPVISNKRDDA